MNITARRLSRFRHLSTGCLAIGVLGSSLLAAGAVHAASFGHARLASAAGEPFLVLIPVSDLTPADEGVLSARPAPAEQWLAAGLTPPVSLDSLTVSIAPSAAGEGRRVLRVSSKLPFTADLADLLLDVSTASGQQRYQVSLVSPAPGKGAAVGQASGPGNGSATTRAGQVRPEAILVKPGDNLFKISRYRVPQGASIYQLMMAFQRVNPRAFIHDNVNLVRAGATLNMPDLAEILSISDAEARRQFMAHVAAFKRLRGALADSVPSMAAIDRAMASQAQAIEAPNKETPAQPPVATVPDVQDRLRLTEPVQSPAPAPSGSTVAAGAAVGPVAVADADAVSRPSVLSDSGPLPGTVARSDAAASAQSAASRLSDSASSHDQASNGAASAVGSPAAKGMDSKDAMAAASGVAASSSDRTDAASTAVQAQSDATSSVSSPSGAPSASAPSAADTPSTQEPDTAPAAVAKDSDTVTARQHALEEAESRISQLEDNIKNLDQALKSQGEAARSAIVQGVEALGSSLGHLADVIGDPSDESSKGSDAADTDVADTDVAGAQAADQSAAAVSGSMGAEPDAAGPGVDVAGTKADVGADTHTKVDVGADTHAKADVGADAGTKDTSSPVGTMQAADSERLAPGAGAEAVGANDGTDAKSAGTAGGQATSGAAPTVGDSQPAGATDSSGSAGITGSAAGAAAPAAATQAAGVAGATEGATGVSSGAPGGGPEGAQGGGAGAIQLPAPADSSSRAAAATPGAAVAETGSWWQQHAVKVVSGILALLVLIIAWVLRRASKAREAAALRSSETHAMVSEKIRDIDLDLK